MSKIKRVVLYKHGVGHFERQAEVDGDGEITLSFRTEEMNDVLKSLTVFDGGGGVVSSVSYDNKKPLSKLLEEISLDLPDEGGSVGLLGALRGAEVAVTVGARTLTGQVVGVDTRVSERDGSVIERKILTLFDDQGRLQSFDLDEVSHVAFLDPALQADMRFFFRTVYSGKKQDAKTLKIFSRGEGPRRLDISYVVECPVWKTSYRIALPDTKSSDQPYLQGWALVDNPQDEDWTEIYLSLVSGLPISFRHDLYSPRYLSRREVEVQTESAAGPVMAEGNFADLDFMEFECAAPAEAEPVAAFAPRMMMQRSSLGGAGVPPSPPRPAATRALQSSAAQVETVTQKVGQLFEYRIDKPVTVLRNQSALVPIVSAPFDGGKKLLYNEANRAENPYSVVDFKNTSGLTLEGGPVTIFEGEIYAGEAMLDTLSPGEERMLPYAVALEVEVKTEVEHDHKCVSQSIARGVWRQQMADYKITRYRLKNNSEEPKIVVVEHPISQAELVSTPKPDSETRNFWRFKVDLTADGQYSLKVVEKTVRHQSSTFSNTSMRQVYALVSGFGASPQQSSVLRELDELLRRGDELAKAVHDLERQIEDKKSEQARIRENLKSLGDTQEERTLRSRYVSQLDADETDFQNLREKLLEANREVTQNSASFYQKAQAISLESVFDDQL